MRAEAWCQSQKTPALCPLRRWAQQRRSTARHNKWHQWFECERWHWWTRRGKDKGFVNIRDWNEYQVELKPIPNIRVRKCGNLNDAGWLQISEAELVKWFSSSAYGRQYPRLSTRCLPNEVHYWLTPSSWRQIPRPWWWLFGEVTLSDQCEEVFADIIVILLVSALWVSQKGDHTGWLN